MDPIEAVKLHGSVSAAARAIGVPRKTLDDQYKKALHASDLPDPRAANYQAAAAIRKLTKQPSEGIILPDVVDPNLPIDELLDQATKRFNQLHAHHSSADDWPVIKIKDMLPVGVLWFGDPHLGDNGCNLPLIRKHAALCKNTAGLYGANIGDTTNNWETVGKLAKKWAQQDSSIYTEQRLAQWFMTEA